MITINFWLFFWTSIFLLICFLILTSLIYCIIIDACRKHQEPELELLKQRFNEIDQEYRV